MDSYLAVHSLVNAERKKPKHPHIPCLTRNLTSGNSAQSDILDSAKLTANSLQACVEIAEANPKSPVTAIADAAFQSDPKVMGGNSVVAFTPHVTEKFGNVISILTFANSNVVQTEEGLVMIDCGTVVAASRIFDTVREITQAPLHAAIYTHGHVDHVCNKRNSYVVGSFAMLTLKVLLWDLGCG